MFIQTRYRWGVEATLPRYHVWDPQNKNMHGSWNQNLALHGRWNQMVVVSVSKNNMRSNKEDSLCMDVLYTGAETLYSKSEQVIQLISST